MSNEVNETKKEQQCEEQPIKQKSIFEKNIKPALSYVGTIGSILMVVAYVVIVFIMVFGFSVTDITQTVTFAVVNAIVGFIIMQLLRIQGIDFAKQIPYNQKAMKDYNALIPKDEKHYSMKRYWAGAIVKDLITKVTTIIITTTGLIYIVIAGSRDYMLFLMAVVNIIMFICFGLLALVNSYEFYNEQHIPFIIDKTSELQGKVENERKEREEKLEAEIQRRLELAKEELIKQRDVSVHTDRGSDILDTSVDTSNNSDSNSESMVVDNLNRSDSILGRSIHSSDASSIHPDCGSEETLQQNQDK